VAVEALLRVLAGCCHDGKSTEHLRDPLGRSPGKACPNDVLVRGESSGGVQHG